MLTSSPIRIEKFIEGKKGKSEGRYFFPESFAYKNK